LNNIPIAVVGVKSKEDYFKEMEEQWQKELRKMKLILKRGY
jgi:hypothetical protein